MLDFQVHDEHFRKLGIRVVAASADPPEKAKETVQHLKLSFPVACGLDPKAVSSLIGAYYEAEPGFLHATGFLIRPDGRIVVSLYSSRSIGRLTASDVASLAEVIRSREKS